MDLNQLSQNPEQIQQLISLLQSLLPKEQQKSQKQENSTQIDIEQVHRGDKEERKQPKRENKFLSMPEINMHKEDRELDEKLAKHAPVARARAYDPITVLCRVCGKKETVSPSLVESAGRYKCNKCAASAG